VPDGWPEGFGPGPRVGMRPGYSVIEATNWYAYVSNNPVKYVDPTGMFEGYIDESVNNKLKEEYVSGENDCDIWVEDTLKDASKASDEEGKDETKFLPEGWQAARENTVAGHRENMKDSLQDDPEIGTNIGLSDDGHTILLHLNKDKTVEVAHTSSNNDSEAAERYSYKNMDEFRKSFIGNYQFIPIPDTASLGGGASSPNTGAVNSGIVRNKK